MESQALPGRSLPPSCITPILGVIVSGCSGRMGRRLLSLVLADPMLRLLGGICRSAAQRVPRSTRQGAFSEHVQEKGLMTSDPLAGTSAKVSNYLAEPGVAAEAADMGQWSEVIQKRKQVEREAPVCASLQELLALPEFTQGGSNPAIVVDFSHPAATMALLQTCVRLHIPMIVGTTGFSAEDKLAIKEAAKKTPLCVAANFSLGVNLLIKLVGDVTSALGEQFDIEVVESHHRLKADAPSGTALSLLDSIAKAKQQTKLSGTRVSEAGSDPAGCKKRQPSNGQPELASAGAAMTLVHGRLGVDARRKKEEVGVHSLRLGNVVGEHTIIYASVFEKLVLQHHAESRDVFAVGALKMAKWLASQPKGEYSVDDMLFEKSTINESCLV